MTYRSREEDWRRRERGDWSPTFRDRPHYGEDEGYFGGGRQSYGDGTTWSEPNRGFGHSWRDSTGYSNYDYPERNARPWQERGGFGRESYGMASERDREYGRWPSRDVGGESWRQSEQNTGRWSSNYPSSERGFYDDRGERSWWDRTSDEISSWFGDEEAERRREMDMRRGLRGRGPRGYTRSDDRIREDINDRLTDYDYIDASDVEVEVKNGDVVLSGTVESRWEKRLAEDIAEDISGVKNVENRLRVQRDHSVFGTSGTEASTQTGHNRVTETAATGTSGAKSRHATGRG